MADGEVSEAASALSVLGGSVEEVSATCMEKYGVNHRIVYVKKVKKTPASYPRKAGTPERNPL